MGAFKLSYNEMHFLIYLCKWINNPNSHQLMLNELQVKHQKISYSIWAPLVTGNNEDQEQTQEKIICTSQHQTDLLFN